MDQTGLKLKDILALKVPPLSAFFMFVCLFFKQKAVMGKSHCPRTCRDIDSDLLVLSVAWNTHSAKRVNLHHASV